MPTIAVAALIAVLGEDLIRLTQAHHRHMRPVTGVLALGAMMLQLLLSFGHVHARDFPVRLDGSTGWSRLASAQLSSGPSTAPDDNDDLCAICVSASQLANSFVPAAPQLADLRDARDSDHHVSRVGHLVHLPPHGPFQPRAPPA